MISLIVAHDSNRAIGKDNSLPWHMPVDLRYFKEKTTGKTIVMGRNTYESIGKPLPNRKNIVLTSNKEFKAEGVHIANSIDDVMQWRYHNLFIIGGASIYEQFLPLADFLYVTEIHGEFEGDTYFPHYDKEDWEELMPLTRFVPSNGINTHDATFKVYRRSY